MVNLAKNKHEFLEFFLTTSNAINTNVTENDNLIFYPITEILFLAISSMLSGAEDWHAIALFSQQYSVILKQYLPFKFNIPCIIINRLFSCIDNKYCNSWLRDYISILLKNLRIIKNNMGAIKYLEYISCEDCGLAPQGLFIKTKTSNNCQQFNVNYSQSYNDNIIEIKLSPNNQKNQHQAANNMLILRQIVIDIIKKYKIKKCSRLGINVIRRLASNNKIMLVDILDQWIYADYD